MTDIFDETIMCNKCNKKMEKVFVMRNGFKIRALECKKCGKHIYHPSDIEEFKKFSQLKRKPFNVKLRMVGHSYVVSIPHEIIKFQEQAHREMRNVEKEMARHFEHMNKIVNMWLEEPGRVTLSFGREREKERDNDKINKIKEKEKEEE